MGLSERKEWERDIVLNDLPKGWHILAVGEKETLAKGNSRLSLEDAFELRSKFYDLGYNSALQHISTVVNKELEDDASEC